MTMMATKDDRYTVGVGSRVGRVLEEDRAKDRGWAVHIRELRIERKTPNIIRHGSKEGMCSALNRFLITVLLTHN